MIATTTDLQEQIEQLDEKIIDLLEERWRLCTQASDGVSELKADTLLFWTEEAGDRGLDEDAMEKVCRSVMSLSRKEQE